MSLIKELIKKRVEKIGTKPAKEAAKIFKLHKDCLEEIIGDLNSKPPLESMIFTVIKHEYSNLPPPDEIDYWCKHTYDIDPKLATKLRKSYWGFQHNIFELNRTDISNKKKVRHFAKIPELYNACMSALAQMAKSEKEVKPEEHYEIA